MGYGQPRNLGRGETGGRAALPIWIDYMRTALKGAPDRPRIRPPGLSPIRHPDSDITDFYYEENPPPQPPPPPPPEEGIPFLRYFLDDNAWRSQPDEAPPMDQPAPFEERVPLSIREMFLPMTSPPAPEQHPAPAGR
jgi:penicillin-binding protein 1A